MSVPMHRDGCKTRTWRTRCRDCKAEVFFFSCSCNSKVFFDRLGPPWPRHDDHCIPHLFDTLLNAGTSAASILSQLQKAASAHHKPIPEQVLRTLQEKDYLKRRRPTVALVLPGDNSHLISGYIISSNAKVNFHKRFGLKEGPYADAFLKDLAASPFSEIRVRETPDPKTGVCAELECFVATSVVEELNLRDSVHVTVAVTTRELPGDHVFWVAVNVERLH